MAIYIFNVIVFWSLLGSMECKVDTTCTVSFVEPSTFDCRHKKLHKVPTNIPISTRKLLLSYNQISHLSRKDLKNLPNLTLLDLSHNCIESFTPDIFRDLNHLELLDLSFNPLNYSFGLPVGIFDNQHSSLRVLKLTTNSTQIEYPGQILKPLKSLKELCINPVKQLNQLPKDIAELPIRVLNMQCPEGYRIENMTKNWLQYLKNSSIEDLSFFGCGIRVLENGSFEDFSSLHTLNLGGNPNLGFENAIYGLSRLGSTPLQTLVLDFVTEDGLEVTSKHFCNEIGDRVQRLSIKHNSVNGIKSDVVWCFKKLSMISLGYNSPQDVYYTATAWFFATLEIIDYSHLDSDTADYMTFFYDRRNEAIMPMEHFFHGEKMEQVRWDETTGLGDKGFRYYLDGDESAPLNTQIHVSEMGWTPDFVYISRHLKKVFLDRITLYNMGELKPVNFSTPNILQLVNLSGSSGINGIYWFFMAHGLTELQIVDSSYSSCGKGPHYSAFKEMEKAPVPHYPNLRVLWLAGNYIYRYMNKLAELFQTTPLLEELNLSDNGIEMIPSGFFVTLTNMKRLDFSHNAFTHQTKLNVKDLHSLQELDISCNSYTHLPTDLLEDIDNIRSATKGNGYFALNISGNPFVCGCSALTFLSWMQTADFVIDRESIMCITKSHDHLVSLMKVSVTELKRQCLIPSNTTRYIIIGTVPMGVMLMLSLVAYKFRWRLRWMYYKYKHASWTKRRHYAPLVAGNGKDCYIIYCEGHEDDRLFVTNVLKHHLEDGMGFSLFFNGRDDRGGSSKAEEIIRGITENWKCLVLITPNFLKDSWCDFAVHMLIEGGDLDKKVCMLLREDVDVARMKNKVLRRLLSPQAHLNVKYYNPKHWPQNIHKEMVFWEELKDFLSMEDSGVYDLE